MHKGPDPESAALILEACLAQVQTSKEWFSARVLPLSLDQLRWRPRARAWSIAECLDHLNQTLAYYLPKIEQTVAHPSDRVSAHLPGPAFPETERHFLAAVDPPVRDAWSAPPPLAPASPVDADRMAEQFPLLRDRFAQSIRSASGLDLAGVPIAASLHPPVQSLGGVIALLAAHDRRHLWQAERILSAPAFPASLATP